MGTGKRIVTSATGFPLNSLTMRFIQSAWREALEGLAKMAGDKTILAGMNLVGDLQGNTVVQKGFVSYNGEIMPFVQSIMPALTIPMVTIVEEVTNGNYDADIDNDGQQDSLPQYINRYMKIGTDGIVTFPFSELTRLRTMEDLSSDDLVFDPEYVHTDNNFTLELLQKLNGIESGAEVNVQADWNEESLTADPYIMNKPFKKLKIVSGTLQATNGQGGYQYNNYNANVAYVYPPYGFQLTDLVAFIPSINYLHFGGDVNSDDITWCRHWLNFASNKIHVYGANSEFQGVMFNYLAVWKK